jgi:CubicO group peptidase (beta-lactamase class C family)
MFKHLRFFSLLILFFLYVTSAFSQRASLESILPILEPYVQKAMKDWGVPGAAIGIVMDGKVVYAKGFGTKEINKDDLVNEQTLFQLASLTKNFTDTLIAILIDKGLLSWDDKVVKYLPDFELSDPKVTQEFTIRDLLAHRSGLPGFVGDTLMELGWSQKEMIQALKKIPFKKTFRKDYDYQNIFVGIAGLIIEKVTGRPLAEIYQDYLFGPVSLKTASIGIDIGKQPSFWQKIKSFFSKDPLENVARPHDHYQSTTRLLPDGNPAIYRFPSTSGINMSVQDAAKWLVFQLNDADIGGTRLVSSANLKEMRTPQVHVGAPQGGRLFPKERVKDISYGMGWFIHDYADVQMLSHMGGMTGTRALLSVIPEERVGIIILSNVGGMRVSLFPEAVRAKFFDMYLGIKDDQDWSMRLLREMKDPREKYMREKQLQRLKSPAPRQDWNFYVGEYENSLYGKVQITHEGDNLYLHYRNGAKVLLTHWNANSFSFIGSDLSVSFSGTDMGDVTFGYDPKGGKKSVALVINLLMEGEDPVFKRIS